MNENLIQDEIEVDENLAKELQAIIYKYRRHIQKQSNYINDSTFRSMKQKDPESFQNEYSMSKFPGDVEEAKQKKKNYTINQIYLNKKKKIDWLFFNIYNQSYLIETYGMGVPLFFTMMKMTISVLMLLFLINLYTGLNQFNVCKTDQCYSYIGGGLGIIDIVNMPSDFMISLSFGIWVVYSYILKLYIYKICNQDDEIRKDYAAKSNQIILKYFSKGLSNQQVEERLTQKFYEYIQRENIGILNEDMNITLSNVTPITNFYKISKKIKATNKLYMKIIKKLKLLDENIMRPQQSQDIRRPNRFQSISLANSINFNQNEDQTSNKSQQNEEQTQNKLQYNEDQTQNEDQNQQKLQSDEDQNENKLLQIEDQTKDQMKSFMNQKEKEDNNQEDESDSKEQQLCGDKQQNINLESNLQNKIDDQLLGEKDIVGELSEEQKNEVKQNEYNSQIFPDVYDYRYLMDDAEQNNQLSSHVSKDDRIQIVDLFYCKQILVKQYEKKIKQLTKLLKKYQQKKQQLQDEYVSSKTLSSSYIIKCKSLQQKNLILIFLKPQNQFKSFFQKAKYIFRKNNSSYTLDRYYPQGATHLNINWQTIGIELQDKLQKQVLVQILGFVQFVLSFVFIYFIYAEKSDNDSSTEGSRKEQYLKKALFSFVLTLFYLISENIYDLYSNHMIISMNSKRTLLYMQNLFFFYSLYYIILPLTSVIIYGNMQLLSSQNEVDFTPFQQIHPFQIFVTNFLVAATLFSLKSIFPVKLIKRKLIQYYYLKTQRYLKKTQYELNKIFRRQKFRLEDCTLSLFNLLVITIPFTFCLPILLILPIFYLFVMYFAFKYQYLMVLRPKYYCKSIHKKTSKIFANYIQRVSFLSYIFFTSNIFLLASGIIFYAVYSVTETFVVLYIKYNFKKKQASRFEFINNMIGHFQDEKKTELTAQLGQAVEQYQYFTQSVTQSSTQSRVFYYNQQQIHTMSDQISQTDSQFRILGRSETQFNPQKNKKFHYSFMLQYQKYKYILDQSKLFHSQKV